MCLALPDTIVRPINAFATLCAENLRVPCDLHLGVFPTEHPERFGPVRFDPSGRVMEVLEKPKRTEVMNTWGIAVWSDRFSEFLHGALSKDPGARSQSVGLLFNRAVAEGLTVNAVYFSTGTFLDLGDPANIGSVIIPKESQHEPEKSAPVSIA